MKRFFLYCLLFLIIACENNKKIKIFYPDGNLRISIETDENGIPNGRYIEYYNSGEVKITSRYVNGIIGDTAYCYYRNGILREKGIMKDNYLKLGWWKLYNDTGDLVNTTEYYSYNEKQYRNQWIDFDKNGDTLFHSSNFYKIYINDTIKLGKNVGKVKHYSSSKSKDKFYVIAINNQISETRVDKDTFSQESNITRFGIYAHKIGRKKIRGDIIETNFYTKIFSKDSTQLDISKRHTLFEKDVYVKP